MALTPKQKLFADEYLVDLNATRAYKVAYPNVKKDETARANGSRLLTNANVAGYIQERMDERSKRTEINQDMVLKELAKIGFANVTDFVTIEDDGCNCTVKVKSTYEIPQDKLGAIAGIKEGNYGIEVKLNDKVKALELLGKHFGLFEYKESKPDSAYNNLLDAIANQTREDISTDEIQELQQTSVDDVDMVE